MNYYNPYYIMAPMMRPSLFSSLKAAFSGINFSSIINGTQRTLNLVNQAIPLVKQAKPVVQNAKTMFRVMNEFKRNTNVVKNEKISNNEHLKNESGPKFFI